MLNLSYKIEDMKETLINKIRKYPLIWDPRHDDYKDADQKTQVWDKIRTDIRFPKGKFILVYFYKGMLVFKMYTDLDRDLDRISYTSVFIFSHFDCICCDGT